MVKAEFTWTFIKRSWLAALIWMSVCWIHAQALPDSVDYMQAFKEFCAANGHPFTVDSCPDGEEFDMGDASGRFTYNEDPDGTLIEYVETHKIPVIKKLGWYIDMKKRDAAKPLPKFLFRMMGLVSREKIGGK